MGQIFSSGAPAGSVDPTVVSISSNVALSSNTINFVNTAAARSLTMPAPVSGARFWIKDVSFLAATNNITFLQNSGEKLEGTAQSYVYSINGGAAQWASNGTDWFLM